MWTALVLGGIVLALVLFAFSRNSRTDEAARGRPVDSGYLYPGVAHDQDDRDSSSDSADDAQSVDGGSDSGSDLVATVVATLVVTVVVVTAVAEAGNDGRNGCLRAHALHNTPQIDAQLAKDDLSRIPARRHGDARARMTAGTTQVDVGNGSLVAA
jgi:hypothetical protein